MRQFFKIFFASFFAGIALLAFLVLLLVGIGAAAASKNKTYAAPANSVLKLDVNYDIPERSIDDPLANIDWQTGEQLNSTGLYEIVRAIRFAKTDDNIKGIYLPLGMNENGYATLNVLRRELADFKQSGKFVLAYGDMATQKSYYLSTVADKVYLNPNGGLLFNGMGREIMYFKNAFEKFGVDVQDFHCGQYKSAIEPFLRDKMSDANREQLKYLMGNVWNQVLTQIAADRKTDTARINEIANGLLAENAEAAKAVGLVDDNIYFDQLLDQLRERTGKKKKDKVELIELNKYVRVLKDEKKEENRIAVLFAEGDIVDGNGQTGEIGGDDYSKQMRKLREDDKVKAIVLRVNSPGGSALASDLIWREVVLAKKSKPVVVSFGNVAASGGYYISCAADKIFAEPTTITGSIGVFGLIPNFKKFYNEKLGITFDEVEVTQHGVLGGNTKPMDEHESAVIQRDVEKVYREFKQRVAEGRKRDVEYVETVAQGRVWTGTQALERGLVDEIGSLDDAIAFAAKKAGLKTYSTKNYPSEKQMFEKLMESFENTKTRWIREELGEQYETYRALKSLKEMRGVQTRLPFLNDLL